VNSANSHVNEILASAQKRKEHLQFIRAKIYHYKFYQINNENSNHYILDDVNTTLAKLPAPYKNILFGYKALMLEQYLLEHQWKSRDRSETDDAGPDIETWSMHRLRDSIKISFDASLQEEKLLIKTQAKEIESLLFTIPLHRKYRPTLFDVLAHRALDFYSNTSHFASVNAEDEFSFKRPELYSDTPQFQ